MIIVCDKCGLGGPGLIARVRSKFEHIECPRDAYAYKLKVAQLVDEREKPDPHRMRIKFL